ncbi:hypothetical protein HI914_01162 [Erysiphe necator]|nr:hypothetical protein HI914_01162 [Erysiphe necator]
MIMVLYPEVGCSSDCAQVYICDKVSQYFIKFEFHSFLETVRSNSATKRLKYIPTALQCTHTIFDLVNFDFNQGQKEM